MMSSSSATGSAPSHPEAAEDESAAIDHGHPRLEPVADEEIADQGQRDDTETDRDKGRSDPQPDHAVDQHEIDRPERPHLTRRKMAEHAGAEIAECEKQH